MLAQLRCSEVTLPPRKKEKYVGTNGRPYPGSLFRIGDALDGPETRSRNLVDAWLGPSGMICRLMALALFAGSFEAELTVFRASKSRLD